jgi:hypothetical protein
LGGTEVDVAANGHCGWLAFYAALYNISEGLTLPSNAVATHTNLLKKRILNEKRANLQDEAKLHPAELRTEAAACGGDSGGIMNDVERVCVVANHLAEQRVKTVRASVPMHFWVRPMHLKAMAMHAWETIYVLDVQENGKARLQVYAYHNVKDDDDEWVETSTVCPVPTVQAMAVMAALVKAGIRPPVMILRWSSAGNHFRAVHYEEKDHDNYAKNLEMYAPVRNRILVEHGWKSMNCVAYDAALTAKAAATTLTRIRGQAIVRPGLDAPAASTTDPPAGEQLMQEGGLIPPTKRGAGEGGEDPAEGASEAQETHTPRISDEVVQRLPGDAEEQQTCSTTVDTQPVIGDITQIMREQKDI